MYIPPHISEEAKEFIQGFPPYVRRPPLKPQDLAGWQAMRDELHPIWRSFADALKFEYVMRDETIGGVPCVWMETSATSDEEGLLYYIHSGGYCLGEPRVNCALPLQIAHLAGIKVLAVDYRKAPEHPFPAGLDDVVNVYKALLASGQAPGSIAWFGDSAGGALTAAGFMRLRAEQVTLPAAGGMISAMADLTGTGDSYHTLADQDPMQYNWDATLEQVHAYCQGQAADQPLVSPVYGDFTGFPPLLIQVATKEIMLSDSIRLYQRAKEANVDVRLDVWEGLWHVFQALPQVPEARQACLEMAHFLRAQVIG